MLEQIVFVGWTIVHPELVSKDLKYPTAEAAQEAADALAPFVSGLPPAVVGIAGNVEIVEVAAE